MQRKYPACSFTKTHTQIQHRNKSNFAQQQCVSLLFRHMGSNHIVTSLRSYSHSDQSSSGGDKTINDHRTPASSSLENNAHQPRELEPSYFSQYIHRIISIRFVQFNRSLDNDSLMPKTLVIQSGSPAHTLQRGNSC
ncbi:hypothetical protein D3C85_1396660 [compost metagenome]